MTEWPEWNRDGLVVTTDPARADVDAIHAALTETWWARGIDRATVATACAHSLVFSLLDGARQIGVARLVTDRATFAYLTDVWVHPDYRRRGLGKWLVSCAMGYPGLEKLRAWMLGTADAHRLYSAFGFEPGDPAFWMARTTPAAELYQ